MPHTHTNIHIQTLMHTAQAHQNEAFSLIMWSTYNIAHDYNMKSKLNPISNAIFHGNLLNVPIAKKIMKSQQKLGLIAMP